MCSYLDAAATLLLEEDVLRLHVAVDDFVPVEGVETLEQRVRELAHQLEAEALELVLLDELVQIDGQQLERDAHVRAEREVVVHVDDVHGIVLVLLAEVLEDADLLLRLPMEALLVAHHLERHVLVQLVVVGLDHLSEAALADDPQHLVAVGDVVVRDVDVRALLVVVAAVVARADDARPLLGVGPDEVDLRVVEDLVVLVRRQLAQVQFGHLLGGGHHRLGLGGRRGGRLLVAAVAAARAGGAGRLDQRRTVRRGRRRRAKVQVGQRGRLHGAVALHHAGVEALDEAGAALEVARAQVRKVRLAAGRRIGVVAVDVAEQRPGTRQRHCWYHLMGG